MKSSFSVFTSAFLIVMLAFALSVTGFAGRFKGDVNDDDKVSIADAKIVLRYIASGTELDETQINIADMNSDGRLSIVDAKWILQVVAGTREPSQVTQAEASASDTTEPDTTEPDTTKPDTTEPDITQPVEYTVAELEEKISFADSFMNEVDLSYYTEETVDALYAAVSAGRVIVESENPSSEEIKVAINDIDNALSELKSLKQCLEDTIEIAQNYDLTACEEELINRLNIRIRFAQRMADNEKATPIQLKNARNILINMLNELDNYKQELLEAKQLLSEAIDTVKSIDVNAGREGSAFTAVSIERFNSNKENVILNAQAVYDDIESTKSEVETAKKNIDSTISFLVTYRENLKSGIKRARDIYSTEKLNGSPDLKSVIDRVTNDVYLNEDSTDADYEAAALELANAVVEFHQYFLEHTGEGVINWT